jgi:hypothetical protein
MQMISNLFFNRSLATRHLEKAYKKNPYQKLHQREVQKKRWRTKKFSAKRKEFVHFCEHDGIYIHFTKARSTWHALAPCALKPWWLFLKPLRKPLKKNMHETFNAN